MHTLESTYWWFQGRREIILSLLDGCLPSLRPDGGTGPLRLLDVGCGTGMLLEDLNQRGCGLGLDFSPVALEYCRQRDLPRLGRADVRHMPVASASVDLITALDLVEHIRDDVGLLGEFHRILRPGGVAIMSVPAHKRLWSGHDVALHHFRRYEKREFGALVEGAGFAVEKLTFAVAVAYLPATVFRRLKPILRRGAPPTTDEFPLPLWVNAALRRTLTAEARYLRRRNLPFGLSILCIARKAR